MSDPCEKCKGLCCRYFCFEIDEPDDYEEFEDIRWYLYHEAVSVHIEEEGDWYIQIENPCKMLDDEYRCSIYEDRPHICRNYADEDCEATSADYGYQEEFKTPEQLVEYARKTLGEEAYELEMIKYRAKAERIPRKEMKKRLLKAGLIADGGQKSGKKAPKRRRKKKQAQSS